MSTANGLLDQEFKCIGDCLREAEIALQKGNINQVEIMAENIIKSCRTIKGVDKGATVILTGRSAW